MTDPVYGDHPIDPQFLWDSTIRPSLAGIAVVRDLGVVWSQALAEILEADWLTRWRRTLATAEGVQLDTWAATFSYLCPDGWSEDRCRAVLMAIVPAALATPTTARAFAVATAVLDVGQTVTYEDEFPCSGRFTFLDTSADDAISYVVALERARPRACQFFVVAHPGGGGPPFVINSSQISGLDTIGVLFGP